MISLLPRFGRSSAITRRDLLRMGAATSAASAFSSPLLQAATQPDILAHTPTAKRCIYIFLCGGPSQLEMWDPKPEAPSGIRGPFNPISTNVPGIQIGELLPQVSQHADKLALIRSMTHDSVVHEIGIAYTLLGTVRPPSKQASPPAQDDFPGVGAVLQSLLGAPQGLPAWVVLPRVFTTGSVYFKGQTGGFLGSSYDPFALQKPKRDSLGDPELTVESLKLPQGMNGARLDERRQLLSFLERNRSLSDAKPSLEMQSRYDQAFSLLSAGGARTIFDLEQEPVPLRDRYGMNEYGQSFLMARRLIENDVRMVNVFWTFYGKDGCQFNLWDNHGSEGKVCGGANRGVDMLTHDYCCPSFDRAFSALLEDLDDRGLLDETLVVVTGEFGRTPRINKFAGRDHRGNCCPTVLAGGGIQGRASLW
ncbi:MAG: DUF1501 domain-containing protein [Planctomycetaceae bacterium]